MEYLNIKLDVLNLWNTFINQNLNYGFVSFFTASSIVNDRQMKLIVIVLYTLTVYNAVWSRIWLVYITQTLEYKYFFLHILDGKLAFQPRVYTVSSYRWGSVGRRWSHELGGAAYLLRLAFIFELHCYGTHSYRRLFLLQGKSVILNFGSMILNNMELGYEIIEVVHRWMFIIFELTYCESTICIEIPVFPASTPFRKHAYGRIYACEFC